MKYAHNIKLSVFVKDSEDPIKVGDAILTLIPFDIVKEKIELKKSIVDGFEEKKIIIFELILKKSSHVSRFIANLQRNLSLSQKQLILQQASSRLDPELDFFIRLDKSILLEKNKLELTDSGNCFHIRIAIASYPAKREPALEIVKKLFATD